MKVALDSGKVDSMAEEWVARKNLKAKGEGHLQFWLQDNFSGVGSRPGNWRADSPVENAFQGEPPCFSSNADFTENQ